MGHRTSDAGAVAGWIAIAALAAGVVAMSFTIVGVVASAERMVRRLRR